MVSFSSTSLFLFLELGLLHAVSGMQHVVTFSDAPAWTVGIGVGYADMNIVLGEALSFSSTSSHDVALLHVGSLVTPWSQCGQNGIAGNSTTIWGTGDFTDTSVTVRHYTPPSCGDFYIACSMSAHCMFGQRVKVSVRNADNSTCNSSCSNATCVTPASKATDANVVIHGVAPIASSGFWGQGPYSAMTVDIGDAVVFRTGAGFHDLAMLPTKADFDTCDVTQKTVVADWTYGTTSPTTACNDASACCSGTACGATGNYVTYTFNASVAGDAFFVCSYGYHCKQGQKIHVTVRGASVASTTSVPNGISGSIGAGTSTVTRQVLSLCLLATFW